MHFPNEKQLSFMREKFFIREIRYCSVPDEDGILPAFPRVGLASWGWPVQLVFRRCDNGAREVNWAELFGQLGLVQVQDVPRNGNRQLWKVLADQYGDVRAEELAANVHDLILEVEIAVEIKAVEPILDAPKSLHQPSAPEELVVFSDVAKKTSDSDQPPAPDVERPIAPGMAGAAERMRIRAIWAAQNPKHAPNKKKKSHKKKACGKPAAAAAAVPPPPQEPPYDSLFREFLLEENVYVRGRTKDLNIAGVIRSLITMDVYHRNIFFSTQNTAGLGVLFPCNEIQRVPSPMESTLELHRRAIRLEWAAESMLRALMEACKSDQFECDQEYATDVMDALSFKGGINGQGPDYWRDAPSITSSHTLLPGSLRSVLCKMAEARAAAFSGPPSYLVADECSWGLPIATALFLARRARLQQKAPPLDSHDIHQEISQLNNWRAQAIMQDRAPLVAYGLLLTAYCARLGEIIMRCQPEVAAALPPGALEALPFSAESPPVGQDLTKLRIAKELEKLNATLKELGIERSPAAQQVAMVQASIAEAMASDSHQRAATSRLHPTRSLPGSTYDPLFYTTQSSVREPGA
jgi:hypothetical protein